ncbi:ABC-three component system middle component 1 [Pantoea vagans]|uniref:ABC-three component system middle component 1 n=1 Tax=Pantoea vagans TaxID=470934 RepID=UPI003672E534
MLTIQKLMTSITQRAEGRYEVHLPDLYEMMPPKKDISINAIQLKRINRESAGWRTVLLTAIHDDPDNIQNAFRWAADVRDSLAEPQTADLYMFMLIDGIQSEDAARLETDDRFCRKLVLRGYEDIDSFLDRSFLASLTPSTTDKDISDPLITSLNSLSQVHSWVEPHLGEWREILLSEKTGDEVVKSLRTVTFGYKDDQ